MKIIFQTKKVNIEKVLDSFTSKNRNSGAVISFLGKVRPSSNKKKIKSMDIEIYEEMALYQTKSALRSLLKKLFLILQKK